MGRPSTWSLLRSQTGYQMKIFFRTPVAAFFTLVFPLLLLILFGALFGNAEIEELGVTVAQYYAPALAVFSAANATYSNLGVGTSYQRDEGILKRTRGTPLPPSMFFAGKVLASTIVAFLAAVLMMGIGVFAYGIQIYPRTLPAAVATFLVGTACWAALGLLVAAISPSGPAATAITNATLLPLAFLSGLFIPLTSESPAWLETVGNIFPLKHFNDAFQAAFLPNTTGTQFDWAALAYMAAWGLVAAIIGLRLFKWESRIGTSDRRPLRSSAT